MMLYYLLLLRFLLLQWLYWTASAAYGCLCEHEMNGTSLGWIWRLVYFDIVHYSINTHITAIVEIWG